MIDVIIPAYNAHETIDKTLMSLAIQRLAKYLDITIIDDGSEKPYDDITKGFEKYFKSLRVHRVDKNCGVGMCRQIGLDIASNPFVYFLDSDDYMISSMAFNKMLAAAGKSSADLVFCNIVQEFHKTDNLNFMLENDVWEDSRGCILYFHGKMYSRSMINRYGLKMAPTRSNEDIGFNMTAFTLIPPENIARVHCSVVETICNTSSITRNENSTRKYLLNNVNENMDAYIASKLALDIISRNLGNKTNPKTCKLLLGRYENIFCKLFIAHFDSDDLKQLFTYETALFYRDIVKPIINNWPVPYRFSNDFKETQLNPIINTTTKKILLAAPDINDWSEEAVHTFDQKRFDELSREYLTEAGYGNNS